MRPDTVLLVFAAESLLHASGVGAVPFTDHHATILQRSNEILRRSNDYLLAREALGHHAALARRAAQPSGFGSIFGEVEEGLSGVAHRASSIFGGSSHHSSSSSAHDVPSVSPHHEDVPEQHPNPPPQQHNQGHDSSPASNDNGHSSESNNGNGNGHEQSSSSDSAPNRDGFFHTGQSSSSDAQTHSSSEPQHPPNTQSPGHTESPGNTPSPQRGSTDSNGIHSIDFADRASHTGSQTSDDRPGLEPGKLKYDGKPDQGEHVYAGKTKVGQNQKFGDDDIRHATKQHHQAMMDDKTVRKPTEGQVKPTDPPLDNADKPKVTATAKPPGGDAYHSSSRKSADDRTDKRDPAVKKPLEDAKAAGHPHPNQGNCGEIECADRIAKDQRAAGREPDLAGTRYYATEMGKDGKPHEKPPCDGCADFIDRTHGHAVSQPGPVGRAGEKAKAALGKLAGHSGPKPPEMGDPARHQNLQGQPGHEEQHPPEHQDKPAEGGPQHPTPGQGPPPPHHEEKPAEGQPPQGQPPQGQPPQGQPPHPDKSGESSKQAQGKPPPPPPSGGESSQQGKKAKGKKRGT